MNRNNKGRPINSITKINKVYFGRNGAPSNITRDYLLDDFQIVLANMVQRDILSAVAIEASKNFSNSRTEYQNGTKTIFFGNFDPDNHLVLLDFKETFDIGFLANLRKLINLEKRKDEKKPGACTGGEFIKDISKLDLSSVENYYKKFRDFKMADAEEKLHSLKDKARKFADRGYKDKIITENEGVALHKDKMPEKRKVIKREEYAAFGHAEFKGIKTTTRKIFSIDQKLAADCLNAMADVILSYFQLIPDAYSWQRTLYPSLKRYVQDLYDVFSQSIPEEDKNREYEAILRNLKPSLELIKWQE